MTSPTCASTADTPGRERRLAVQHYRGIAELPPAALAVLEARASAGRSVQFGAAWFANLEHTVFSREPGLHYLTLGTGTECCAVLPLIVTGPRLAPRARALANYYTCLYEPALDDSLASVALAEALIGLRKAHPGIATLTLSPMDPDSAAFGRLEAALPLAGWRAMRYFCFGNWYLRVDGGWAAYLASREGKLRSTIKRMAQRIAAEQGTIEILTTTADLTRGVAAYEAVYAKSWKVPEPSAGFLPGLMHLCADQGAMRLGLVWLKGQPIAAQLWIVKGRRAEIYKVAYDDAFKTYSPGTVLTARLMQHVIEQDRVTEVDYLIGDDAYKKNWMSHRRERWGLLAFNIRSPVGLAHWGVERTKRVAKAAFARSVPIRS